MSSPSGPPLDTELAERVLTRFLREEAARAGFERFVVGVSGGIDSAVSCFLAAGAVGPENVFALAMPWRESNPDSLVHGRLVAAGAGVALEVIDLTDAADGILPPLAVPVGEDGAVRRGNVLARLRMIALFDASERHRALVVGTSNKTEMLLGYTTLYGDSASALNPLGDLWKCQVRELARHLGVPREVVEKPPSADLWAGQTDEGELGFTYDQADAVLSRLVDRRDRPEDVVREGFDADLVDRIRRRMVRSQFKRRPPTLAKLSPRTVGWEHRYARDWES